MTANSLYRGALVSSLLAVTGLAGQDKGSMVGVVVDDLSGEAVVDAEVMVIDAEFRGRTDEDGLFIFPDLPVGAVTLRVQHPGYTTIVEQVEVLPDRLTNHDVRLPPMAAVLRELLVTGRRRAPGRGASVTDLRPEEGAGRTAADLLAASVPGLAMSLDRGLAGRGTEVNIRGTGSFTQSGIPLIYLDGMRIGDHVTADQLNGVNTLSVLRQIPASEVAGIRILRGPAAAAALYPSGADGVIIIETVRGR